MSYQVLGQLKVKTPSGIRELQAGAVIDLPESMALRLIKGGKIKPVESSPDYFDPEGVLQEIISEAGGRGWTDERLMALIYELIQNGCLQAPWGLKVKDSSLMGDYWIICDTTARERIPAVAVSFTIDELRPIVETCRTFPGARVLDVIRRKGKGAVNAN